MRAPNSVYKYKGNAMQWWCSTSIFDNFPVLHSSFVGNLQKSLERIVYSKQTQGWKMIKLIYFVILQQTKTREKSIYSTRLSRTIKNSVFVIRVPPRYSEDVMIIIKP